MCVFAEGQTDWDEVRQRHDAWIEQGRLELVSEDQPAPEKTHPEVLKAIEQQVRAIESKSHDTEAA